MTPPTHRNMALCQIGALRKYFFYQIRLSKNSNLVGGVLTSPYNYFLRLLSVYI